MEGNCNMLGLATDPQVLSIQSHVVWGYVGNKSAVFPLQLLGFEVHAINSVQFSNHTGYGKWTGGVLNSGELADLMSGLESNRLDSFTHILTGYVGSESFLQQVYETVKHLKEKNPNTIYVCDPVMGDNGEMYVPKELLNIYRDKLIPLADIVTPNQFEAELLTGKTILSEVDAVESMQILHSMGAKTVVVSSSVLGSNGDLVAFGSTDKDGVKEAWKIDIPRLPHLFTGTGDLFTALLLAWMYRCNGNLPQAMEYSIGTLQAVLQRTLCHSKDVAASTTSSDSSRVLELRLIQSKLDIENPPQTFQATRLN